MAFILIYLIVSLAGFIASSIIAEVNAVPFIDIITNYFASLTLCGCFCGFFALLFRFIFHCKFNPNWKILPVSKREITFYEFTRIDKWKKLIPDLGKLVNFNKQVLVGQTNNSAYYERFLFENVNASALHFFTILSSPMIFLILSKEFYLSLSLPIIIIVFVLNILPVMLQRYLRPKIYSLYCLTKRREERKSKKDQNELEPKE